MEPSLLTQLSKLSIPFGTVDAMPTYDLHSCLSVIEKLIRQLEGRRNEVVTAIGVNGRDTIARITKTTGRSVRNARQQTRTAKVAAKTPGAAQAMNRGDVSGDHVLALAGVDDPQAAEALLERAVGETVDEFTKTVQEHLAATNPIGLAEKQHNSRSVKFYKAEHGCVGMNVVFPPIEGTEFKNYLEQIVDAAYRKNHPVRAETLGGHDVEPYDRRMADALISLLRGETLVTGKPVLIVTIDADRLTAEVGPGEPIPIQSALALVDRSEIYAAIRHGTNKAKLVFGTNRRLATPLQKLALALFHPTCAHTGCDVPHTHTEAHHIVPAEHGGATDLANLILKCPNHHHHDHEQQQKRGRDPGTSDPA